MQGQKLTYLMTIVIRKSIIILMTKYHAKLFTELINQKHPSDAPEKFINSLSKARIKPMAHQINAALFAFKSPLSNGAILADEVGLGKTIEAGIVLSQLYAENKKQILIIVPSSLRQQWNSELKERFFLDSIVIDKIKYDTLKEKGLNNPFNQQSIFILSAEFFKRNTKDIKEIKWDIVVIDEAHKFRNVYKKNNVLGKAIKEATKGAKKLLLTATPIQNSIAELYGLTSFIDPYLFGDIKSFKANYSALSNLDEIDFNNTTEAYEDLKERLKPIMIRTLREEAKASIKYTNRLSITQKFIPTESELEVYNKVTKYLQNNNLYGLPNAQRKLITLIIRKLLASSTFALTYTFKGIKERLIAKLENKKSSFSNNEFFSQIDDFQDVKEEWSIRYKENKLETKEKKNEELEAIKTEITEIDRIINLAESIKENAKGNALIKALDQGFNKLKDLGANNKALVFTESRRTQQYLYELLCNNGYKDNVVLFNGSNNSEDINKIYYEWLSKNKGKGKFTGSKNIDKRTALTDYFKDKVKIMIATEAASEGLNMQFCSMIINYDLPWNPQRVEQRIGRLHRYGQKHDVVVVNFLNEKNKAEQRILDLLQKKFKLFDGVFGSSNTILGTVATGLDIEKQWLQLLQDARTEEEIEQGYQKILNQNENKTQKKDL